MTYLIDTSVWGRVHQTIIRTTLTSLAAQDEIWTCRVIDLEVLYGTRTQDVSRTAFRRRMLRHVPIEPSILERSLDVAAEMAEAGLHRHAKPNDLIIAAAAESEGLSILHYDWDYNHIASVTGQPTEWVAPAGSLD